MCSTLAALALKLPGGKTGAGAPRENSGKPRKDVNGV